MENRHLGMLILTIGFIVGLCICYSFSAYVWNPYLWRNWGRADECKVLNAHYYEFCDKDSCKDEYVEFEVQVGNKVGWGCASPAARESFLSAGPSKHLYRFSECEAGWVPSCVDDLLPRWMCIPCENDCRTLTPGVGPCMYGSHEGRMIVLIGAEHPFFPVFDFIMTFLVPLQTLVLIPGFALTGCLLYELKVAKSVAE